MTKNIGKQGHYRKQRYRLDQDQNGQIKMLDRERRIEVFDFS